MRLWTIKGYIGQSGRDEVLDWYLHIPASARAKFKSIMQHLVDQPREFWSPPIVVPYKGYEGIYEIRFRIRNVLYRPLGFFGPEGNEFTFLIPAIEQGDRIKPITAPETALTRRNIIMADKERSHVYRI
jgi:hypothetical protein